MLWKTVLPLGEESQPNINDLLIWEFIAGMEKNWDRLRFSLSLSPAHFLDINVTGKDYRSGESRYGSDSVWYSVPWR